MHLPSALLLTPTTSANLRAVALALAPWSASPRCAGPILVEGPPGSGKSSVLQHIASACGFGGDIVELHLDEALDSKALLGSYVCADRPGEFVWQPGVITEAVLAGRWVVIEDVDRAPFEVLAALIPLMQTRTLLLPGRPAPISAHPDFLLLATRTTGAAVVAADPAPPGLAAAPAPACPEEEGQPPQQLAEFLATVDVAGSSLAAGEGAAPVSGAFASVAHLWTRIPVRPLDASAGGAALRDLAAGPGLTPAVVAALYPELRAVVAGLHPRLPRDVIDAIMLVSRAGRGKRAVVLRSPSALPPQVYHIVALAHRLSGGGGRGAAPAGALPPSLQRPWMRSLATYGRSLSPRDVLKFASRVATLTRAGGADGSSSSASASRLSDADREQLLAEALDVFALHVPAAAVRLDMAATLALILGLGEDSAVAVAGRKPALSSRAVDGTAAGEGGAALSVGRASFALDLSRSGVLPGGEVLPRSFAPTRLGLRVLEAAAVCVRMREPTLLVGSTGVGKTTSVQVRETP